MKKLFLIFFGILFALSINSNVFAMTRRPANTGDAGSVDGLVDARSGYPNIKELEAAIKEIVPNTQAQDVIKTYYSKVIDLMKQGLEPKQLVESVAPLAINTAMDILKYGVNVDALIAFMQDQRWSGVFNALVGECQSPGFISPKHPSCIDKSCMGLLAFSMWVVIFLVIKLVMEAPGYDWCGNIVNSSYIGNIRNCSHIYKNS